jgi:hypothetical protein
MHSSKDDSRLRAVGPRTDVRWTATGHERPVFLDEHGLRRRWVLAAGALAGAASTLWLAALLAGAIGFSSLPPSHTRFLRVRSHTATSELGERHRALAADTRDEAVFRHTTASVRRVVDRT